MILFWNSFRIWGNFYKQSCSWSQTLSIHILFPFLAKIWRNLNYIWTGFKPSLNRAARHCAGQARMSVPHRRAAPLFCLPPTPCHWHRAPDAPRPRLSVAFMPPSPIRGLLSPCTRGVHRPLLSKQSGAAASMPCQPMSPTASHARADPLLLSPCGLGPSQTPPPPFLSRSSPARPPI
jgi:hypothetical protein